MKQYFFGFIALLAILPVFPAKGNGIAYTFSNCSYNPAEGGSLSGTLNMNLYATGSDSSYENHFSSASTKCLSITGTGAHPIVAADLNPTTDYGTCKHIVSFPANVYSANFTINFANNTAVEYDRTGTLSVDGYVNGGCQSASITLKDNDSSMGVGFSVNNVMYRGTYYLTRGVGAQSITLRVFRGDTLNTTPVTYAVSGNAVLGSDYTASPALGTGVTIAAGTDHSDITLNLVSQANPVGTRFLTITLQSGTYTVSTNNSVTLAIEDDGPTVSLTASDPFATQPSSTGAFALSRSGGLTKPLTVDLAISGTAVPNVNYAALPASVTFAVNQTSTNLAVTPAGSPVLSEAQSVVLSINPSSSYFMGLTTNAIVTILPPQFATNSVSVPVGRYWRGSGSDPTYWSTVVPLDYQRGTVYSNQSGNCFSLYPGLTSWSPQDLFHWNASSSLSQTNPANRITFNNPIVAFGKGDDDMTPLYFNQTYSFGIYAGNIVGSGKPVTIQAYYRTNYQLAGSTEIYPLDASMTTAWNNYTTNGFLISTNRYGLTTTLGNGVPSMFSWGEVANGAYVLSHTATEEATNYIYLIQVPGNPVNGTNAMVITAAGQSAMSMLYSLDFSRRPTWRSVLLDQPHFDGAPLPPFYAGKTLSEILTNTPTVTNVVDFTPSGATNLDNSPELRRSPVLDQFVSDMGNDPIALANYVLNQIDLTDSIDYNDNGSVNEQSINPGGVTRGALGVFMEKQGSPVEQCALLVYLLRKAGVPAVYQFAPHNGLQLLDARLSRMLKFQVRGSFNHAGQQYTTNTMIPVNYPWVAAYIGTNWVHIFPWLKDYQMTEGFDLFDYMPSNYRNGYGWVRDYVFGNTNLLQFAVDGNNTPRVIFPRFLRQSLLDNHPGISVDDIGMRVVNRQHYYSRWQDFPTPTALTNTSMAIESLSSTGITNVNPALTNAFDTLSVEIYSENDPTKVIRTGEMRLADLHNRQFYVHQSPTNSSVQVSLVLMPYRTGITNQYSFVNDPNLTGKQVVSMTLDSLDDSMGVRFRYRRHRAIAPSVAINPFQMFLELNSAREVNIERPLFKGEQAAICMDYGRVTRAMINSHAADLWTMENRLRTNASLASSISSDVYEGAVMYLAGLSYYQKCDEFDEFNTRLQKFNLLSKFSVGLSKISSAMDSSGALTNGVDPILPNVDMFTREETIVGNGTMRPDSGQPYDIAQQNYNLLAIANGSAEEHQVINQFYRQTNSVSTVRLLQLAQSRGLGIVTLTLSNYLTQGQTVYQGLPLSAHDPDMWKTVTNNLQDPLTLGRTIVYLTPGPITNSAYKGMGALILNHDNWAALVSPINMNGGFGQNLPPATIAPANTPNYDLNDNNGELSLALSAPASGTMLMPDQTEMFNVPLVTSQTTSGKYTLSAYETTYAAYAAALLGLQQGTTASLVAQDFQTSDQNGFLGTPNDAGAQVSTRVADPVNNITGEFYADELDLELPGPIPMALRRHYSSQNLADNQFGYGWKLNIMPYLSLSKKETNIYAADMDGAVLAYVRSTTNTNMWTPTLAANPQLNNNTTAGAGGLVNRLRDYIIRSVNGSVTNYTLYGADGSVRAFQFMKFNSGATTNARPYLTKWTDNRGNYYTFTYNTNTSDADFGQMKRIQCSNGNYFGFNYDVYGHIIEAYTGDGRWIYYDYDNYGDLVEVTLPDGATRGYQYQHATQAVTGGTAIYSTHLLAEEDKPDGRVLINAYDSQRRVTNQWSTAGLDLKPILTATFVYSNNFKLTNYFTNKISGYTLVIDGKGATNRFDYTNNLITGITDPLGQTVQQLWYSDTATAPGYPRSVQQRTDKRGLITQFQYDTNGNVTNTVTTGDLTGDGIVSQTATNTATYNTNNLPLKITDAAGNSTIFVYDANFPFLPQQMILYAGATPVSTNFHYYGNFTNVEILGSIQQTNAAFGMLNRKVRAYGSQDAATNDFTYDGHGFITQSIAYTGTTDPAVTNWFFYNERGQMVLKMDALGAFTLMEYDALNRPIGEESFDEYGFPLSWNFNYYNENGELTWKDGPRFNPEDYIFYDYDGAGRLSTEIHWRAQAKMNDNGLVDGTGIEAPKGDDLFAQSFFEYDVVGNLTRAVDPRGAITTNTWDALGRIAGRKHLDFDGQMLSTESYGYSLGGKVFFHTNALGGWTQTECSTTGQPVYRRNADGSTNGWRYYRDGRLYREFKSNGSYWQTSYDDLNHITTKVFYSAAGSPLATNSTQVDLRGNLVKQTDEAGNVFATSYDKLDRVKASSGPAVFAVSQTGPNSGVFVTNTLPNSSTNFYALASRIVTNVNVLGEKTITFSDSIGRMVGTEDRNASGTLVRESSIIYSLDHHGVTVTTGSGATAISTTTFKDNDGRTLLTVGYPQSGVLDYSWKAYDLAGNLVHEERDNAIGGNITQFSLASSAYDALNRLQTKTDRDFATTAYGYDFMGNLTNRAMPGGLQWNAKYNTAGQLIQEWNSGGTSGTRTNTYLYFGAGDPNAGLLQSKTDGRGVACAYVYDVWQRSVSNIYSGPLPEQNLTTIRSYEVRGLVTNIVEQFANAANGPATSVQLNYDVNGAITSELVTAGLYSSAANEVHDALGRRSRLDYSGGASYGFSWRADDMMISAGNPAGGGTYNYDTAGILTSRAVGVRATTITSRDGEGRPTTIATTVNAGTQLSESLAWSGDGLLTDHTLVRGDFTDARSYEYGQWSRRLSREKLNLNASARWTNDLAYDAGGSAGLGVLTQMGQGTGSSNLWTGTTDSFRRISGETNNSFSFPALGHANGPGTFSALLDGVSVSLLTVDSPVVKWMTTLELSPGAHQLTVNALHPSGLTTASATSLFTNSVAYQTAIDTYDGAGNVIQRVWKTSAGTVTRTQTLSWDARGRLYKVTERDSISGGYDWTAVYDGFNRRLSTTTLLVTNGVAIVDQPKTINQYYDPDVEFLELGVSCDGDAVWKLQGPDLNGSYGGLNGSGGFEGAWSAGGAFSPNVSDARGNVVGAVTNGVVVWSAARPTGYGAVPGYRPVGFARSLDLVQSSAWRGRWVDITGFHQLGLRPYDSVSGRWLAADSMWNEADPNYYTFAGGDPINGFDGDGRCSFASSDYVPDYVNGGMETSFTARMNRIISMAMATGSYSDSGTDPYSSYNPISRAGFNASGAWQAVADNTDSPALGATAEFISYFSGMAGSMFAPSSYAAQARADYQAAGGGVLGVTGVANRYNPVKPFFDAGSGIDMINGNELSKVERTSAALNAFGSTVLVGAGSLNPSAATAAKTVSLDNNALIAAIENGNAAAVDAAIGGRTPIVSRQVVREFLEKGDVEALRQFLSQRGGRVALSGSEAQVQALQQQAASMGRRLGLGDARVAGSATREGSPVITNDKGFRNFLNQSGIGGQSF